MKIQLANIAFTGEYLCKHKQAYDIYVKIMSNNMKTCDNILLNKYNYDIKNIINISLSDSFSSDPDIINIPKIRRSLPKCCICLRQTDVDFVGFCSHGYICDLHDTTNIECFIFNDNNLIDLPHYVYAYVDKCKNKHILNLRKYMINSDIILESKEHLFEIYYFYANSLATYLSNFVEDSEEYKIADEFHTTELYNITKFLIEFENGGLKAVRQFDTECQEWVRDNGIDNVISYLMV